MSAAVSGTDGGEDGAEDGGAGRQTCGVDDGAHRGLTFSRPHGAIAVGDLALNHGRSEGPFARVVGDLDKPRMSKEGQKLITSAVDLGLEGTCKVTGTRGSE